MRIVFAVIYVSSYLLWYKYPVFITVLANYQIKLELVNKSFV